MINFFQVSAQEKDGITCLLKHIFNETENIHDPYDTQKGILGAKEKQEEYTKLFDDIKQNWDTWQEKETYRADSPSDPAVKLHDVVLSNLYLRNGQCEDQLFQNSSESYKNALELLRKHKVSQENSAEGTDSEDTLLNLLIRLNLGKYLRNMSYFESRSRFSLASHEFEKVRLSLEKENRFLEPNRMQLWLEAKINIGRCQKNLYELKEAEYSFKEMVSGLLQWVKNDKKSIFEQKQPDLALPELSGEEKTIYAYLNHDERLADLFFIRALVQLAIVYRKQRDYEKAQSVCEIVISMEPENTEAINNLGVCYRKKGHFPQAIALFKPLMKKGNRFAQINYWKCVLRQEETARQTGDASEKEIQEFLERNEQDWACRLLQARFLQFQKNLDKAYAIFENLYEKYPYIHNGTIGLKAYYNMATCLMQEGKYQQAKRILDEILATCTDDRLAKIDKGWYMMQTNQYRAAKDLYIDVMKPNKNGESNDNVTPETIQNWEDSSNLSTYEQVRQLNNLGECYLRIGDVPKASILFKKVLDKEPKNIEALNFQAQCHMQEGEKLENVGEYNNAETRYKAAIQSLKDAVSEMEKVDPDRKEKLPLISNLIIAKAAYVQAANANNMSLANKEEHQTRDRIYKEDLEYFLLYYPDAGYSQKACCKFAEFLLNNDQSKPNMKDEETINRYRAFSRIQLWKQEEGYEKFSHFIKSPEFMSTGASKRGKILAWLFLIYRDVMEIKKICRYSPNAACNDILIPAHYTTLNTLKILASEEKEKKAHLRLWNTVYMNDPNEGSCFLELLKATCKTPQEQENIDGALARYFPHLNNTKENLAPINSNVYITSFCRQKDDLQMWRLYGDEAKGCSLIFADDFFDIRSQIEGPLGPTEYSDHDYPLYEVQYIDENELLKNGKIKITSGKETAEEKGKQIEEHLESIWNHITKLQGWMAEKKDEIKPNSAAAVTGFVANALNEIRFLFKYSYFEKEEELRLVQFSYHPKFENEAFPIPRMYIDVERDIQLKEVMLGTKIDSQKRDEIVSWLYATGKVGKITESQKHYK